MFTFLRRPSIVVVLVLLYLHDSEHPVEKMPTDVANYQIGPRLRKSHGFHTVHGVRGVGGPRRIQRPSCWIDPRIKLVVRVEVDKRRAWRRDDNIVMFRPRVIHDDLVESGHQKVYDPPLFDLDFVREYHMVHSRQGVPWRLYGI